MNRAAKDTTVGDASMIDKGPPKPTRDVLAKTALATILNIVNPIVQAYDKMHSSNATNCLSTDADPKAIVDRPEASAQFGMEKDGKEDGDRGNIGQRQKGIRALDSSAKVINVEAKLPHVVVASEQMTTASQPAEPHTLCNKRTGQRAAPVVTRNDETQSFGGKENGNSGEFL